MKLYKLVGWMEPAICFLLFSSCRSRIQDYLIGCVFDVFRMGEKKSGCDLVRFFGNFFSGTENQ